MGFVDEVEVVVAEAVEDGRTEAGEAEVEDLEHLVTGTRRMAGV